MNYITSGGRQTKFPLLRRSNLPAAPGVRLLMSVSRFYMVVAATVVSVVLLLIKFFSRLVPGFEQLIIATVLVLAALSAVASILALWSLSREASSSLKEKVLAVGSLVVTVPYLGIVALIVIEPFDNP